MTVELKPTKLNPIVVESATAFNAHHAYVWAEGSDELVEDLGGTHSAKTWAEIAEQAASSLDTSNFMEKNGGTFTGDVTLADGVSLKTHVGKIHDVNDNIVVGGKNNDYGLYIATDGTAAALVGNNTIKDIITSSDVTSTYSSSGIDPVNGTAVASAIANKVSSTDVETIVKCTQAEYDALVSAGTVSATTLYGIIPS